MEIEERPLVAAGLRAFVVESNRIEGIKREPTADEINAHVLFLSYRSLQVGGICSFVRSIAGVELRDKPGMDVRVGNHIPPSGGPAVRGVLEEFVDTVNGNPRKLPLSMPRFSPYEAHVFYERLHPFMDGNGRSGRVIWAWQMLQAGQDPFALPFLHRFYYQSLDTPRKPAAQAAPNPKAKS